LLNVPVLARAASTGDAQKPRPTRPLAPMAGQPPITRSASAGDVAGAAGSLAIADV
jgi:hypothetical protein